MVISHETGWPQRDGGMEEQDEDFLLWRVRYNHVVRQVENKQMQAAMSRR